MIHSSAASQTNIYQLFIDSISIGQNYEVLNIYLFISYLKANILIVMCQHWLTELQSYVYTWGYCFNKAPSCSFVSMGKTDNLTLFYKDYTARSVRPLRDVVITAIYRPASQQHSK